MSAEAIVALVIVFSAIGITIVMRLVFKKSIVFTILFPSLMNICIVAFLAFLVGYKGLENLFWAVPVAIFMILLMVFFLYRTVYQPITTVENQFRTMAEGHGDLTQTLPVKGNNEIGRLSDHYNRFLGNLRDLVTEMKNVSRHGKTIGEQLNESAVATTEAVGEMTRTSNTIQEHVRALGGEIQKTVSGVNSIAEHIENVNQLVETQSTVVVESSAVIEEMIASIQMLEKTSESKRTLADELAQLAETGGQGMESTISSIQSLSESTQLIIDLIEVIDNVSQQTNLLAMNAAIEAAHAGEAGRGFSVVADEIRTLAETTGNNSKQISTSLKSMIQNIRYTWEHTQETGKNIDRLIDGIRNLSVSFKEILMGLQELNSGSVNMNRTISKLVDLTQNVRGSSNSMFEQTKGIHALLQSLQSYREENETGNLRIAQAIAAIEKTVSSVARISAENTENVQSLEKKIGQFEL